MSIAPTKQSIFEAAVDMFSKKGYHNVSVRQIAKRVGIGASSIYNHYNSKEEILEDIFDFYEENLKKYEPNVNELLELVGKEHPHGILKKTITIYPDEILPIMSKVMLIANMLNQSNKRAAKILSNIMLFAGIYYVPILEKMLKLNLIEPLDINKFTLIHSNYYYCASVRPYENCRIHTPDYIEGLELLFQLVKPKGEFAALPNKCFSNFK